MQRPLLEIENLSIAFKNKDGFSKGISDVNLKVAANETLAIVGESGSGKSITALSVLQLLATPPAQYTSGNIQFHRKNGSVANLLSCSAEEIQNIRGNEIAMIFQEPMTSLNPVYTCGSQVMEALQLHQKLNRKAAKEKTISLFQKVQLPEPEQIFKRYPHQLSGGQKQRVMIAMAMSCNPALLIADEPTTALDVTVQHAILTLMQSLQQETGMGIIFITHDLGLVQDFADRVAVMYQGSLVETSKTEDIFLHPQHPYTRALLACRPAMHPRNLPLPVVNDFMETKENSSPKTTTTATTVPDNLNKPLIEVEKLNVWFPGSNNIFKTKNYLKAVDDVSFSVYEGETLGLVGESGCGKTTLGRALLRLIEPTAGSILLRGEDMLSLPLAKFKHRRNDLQIVFQDPYASLNPRISIGAALIEPMLVHKKHSSRKAAMEEAAALLEKVNLPADALNRYPHAFSGGQRQRIVIARALALQPSFIVWDESVSALDVSVQAQILNLLNELKKTYRFTSLFISHDLSVVRYISDRILVMQSGRIVETGESEAVYELPQHPYTRQLLGSIP
ncbi:MAG: ABC transporter ATP-binding protein, partial [Chitinophagaceae bacterium]